MSSEPGNSKNSADPEKVRQAMRSWTTGITVVTSHYNGISHGMTVSSFTSISINPPRLLVSINRSSRTHDLIVKTAVFGVTILSETQREISERFAGRTPDDEDRLAGLETFTLSTGSPFLSGGLAALDCQVAESFVVGDNSLFLGAVIDLRLASTGRPLAYFDQDYRLLKLDRE